MITKVGFVNYPRQYKKIEAEIDAAIKRTLENGDLILRHDVDEFESTLAAFLGVKYVIGTNSCTDSLILSLKAAGMKSGDEVITVSHTFFATVEAIVHCGAKPILVDVADDFLMDMDKVEAAITPATKAVIPVHLNGRVCDMDKLEAICRKHNLIIIEDSAQALGATFNNKKGGSIGLAGCFSFYPAKILGAFGDGGAVATNNESFAEKIRLLRNHGVKNKTEFVLYGFTSRLDNLQAAVLNVKLKHLNDWLNRRREISERYYQGLGMVSGLVLPPKSDDKHFDVYQNYVLRAQRRDELAAFLKTNGVEILIKDPLPLHFHPAIGLSGFSLPYSEELAKKVISLPMYPELENEEIDYVIAKVRAFYAN